MNWQHFQAFLWLRWRLLIQQLKRGGIANIVVLILLAVGAVCFSLGLFVTCLLVGLLLLPQAPPIALLLVWDGLVVFFLFSWCVGLLAELQRSEVLSLDKFLHLPVSVKGVFLINYASSLVSLSLLMALPAMIALSLALVFGRGPVMLLQLPLLATFLLMVTAVTYQFQGWLASLMANKRRRRTVIALVTIGFVLLFQLPQLIHVFKPWQKETDLNEALRKDLAVLKQTLNSGAIKAEEFHRRNQEIQQQYQKRREEADQQLEEQLAETAWLINAVLPPGWLPLGAMAAAEGNVLPSLLGTLGMGLLGMASLWRAYRTTLRLYRGEFSGGKGRPAAAAAVKPAKAPVGGLLEMRLPWLSEPAAAVALSSFRSLTRAPEAKIVLLVPILLGVIFGFLLWSQAGEISEYVRPLLAFAALVMTLFCLAQLLTNQFGYDRGGFRVFVLSAAPRRDILLGKNLALAPLALGLTLVMVAAVQVLYPLRLDYLLATIPQFLSLYLLFCLQANWLSIYAPMAVSSGTLKPANPKVIPILLQFLTLLVAYPLMLIPTLLPVGLGLWLDTMDSSKGWPVGLLLSLVECGAVVVIYHFALTWQGRLLQHREQEILKVVTTKTE